MDLAMVGGLGTLTERLAVIEQRQQEQAAQIAASFAALEYLRDFVLSVLALVAETDCYECVYWSCQGKYAPLTFWVNCNDLFWWATADAEKIEGREDVDALRQAIADVQEADPQGNNKDWGFLLWCARKRKLRPQQPAYPRSALLRPLFDACGPVRTSQEEG